MSELTRRSLLGAGTSPAWRGIAYARKPFLDPTLAARDRGALAEFDLDEGRRLHAADIDAEDPHSAARVGDAYVVGTRIGVFLLVVDRQFRTVARIDAPRPGLRYSGHALFVPERGSVIATCFDTQAENIGYVHELDPDGWGTRGLWPCGGRAPHDMARGPDGRIWLANYGAVSYGRIDGDGWGYRVRDPSVSGLDPVRLSVLHAYSLGPRRPVCPNHIRVGGDGMIYASGIQFTRRDLAATSPWPMRDLVLRREELVGNMVNWHVPLFRFDPDSGAVEEIDVGGNRQRLAQTVAVDDRFGHVFVTYVSSNVLLRVRRDGRVDAIETMPLGIDKPRGVTPIPGTPYVAVNGEMRNIVVLHADTLDVVRRVAADILYATHFEAIVA